MAIQIICQRQFLVLMFSSNFHRAAYLHLVLGLEEVPNPRSEHGGNLGTKPVAVNGIRKKNAGIIEHAAPYAWQALRVRSLSNSGDN